MNRFDPRQSWAFRRRLGLARAAGAFEAFWPAIWPCAAVVGLFLIISLFGLWAWLPMWLHALGLAGFAGALLWTLARARTALRWPDQDAGLGRLEQVNELPHQPLRSIGDRLSGGGEDALTATLWRRHQKRLTQMLSGLRVGLPQSDLPRRDPWALRAAILLLLLVALVEAGNMAPHRLVQAFELHRSDQLAIAPTEVTLWVTPPTYTGRPPIRLEVEAPSVDETVVAPEPSVVALPAGSEALAQLHHLAVAAEAYTLGLDEHQEPFAAVGENSAEASLLIERSGQLRVGSATEDFGSWLIEAVPDQVPEIDFAEPPSATQRGALRSHFAATDDYGVVSVALLLSRPDDETNVERIELMRPAQGATDLDDSAFLDLTPHPWAGLPVVLRLEAIDALEQSGQSEAQEVVLPARTFQHPVARAIIEERRRLAAQPEERDQVATALNGLSQSPELYQQDMAVYLALRSAALRLLFEADEQALEEVLSLLWDTALHVEDGTMSLAERELRELQQALRDALAEGASDEELERLMNELQRAMEDYLDALSRQAQENAQQQPSTPMDPDAMQVERQDLQDLLDQVREMIRTGAREAAQEMLSRLQEMLENLQVAQQGQMGQSQQMLNELQEMVQEQQRLLDQTFGLSRQQDRQGWQDRQGQQGQQGQEGQEGQEGQMGGMQPDGQMGQTATDQDALRRALGELMRSLGEGGLPIPRALGEAELSMRDARDALQGGEAGQALDPQAEAVDQLRQGGQAMMQEMQRAMGQGQGQMPGQQFGQSPSDRDPLGRSMFNQGGADLWGERIPTELDLGRARAILEELHRRAGERHRPAGELDYIERLLRRF